MHRSQYTELCVGHDAGTLSEIHAKTSWPTL